MTDSKLVMTPMLQMAIRMLQLDQDELFAMIAECAPRTRARSRISLRASPTR